MNDKFTEAAIKYESYTTKIKELECKRNKVRQWIGKYVEKHGSQKTDSINCFMQNRTKITYDTANIKKRFGKQARKFVEDHLVFDSNTFCNICKKNGIDRSLFINQKSCERKLEVNEKALSLLLDKGEISIGDLEGCYTIEESSSLVIRMS